MIMQAGKFDHRFALRAGDAVLAVTFAPYSEETLALAADAHARGLAVVALTDRLTSPLVRQADAVLTVPEVDFGAFRSLSATPSSPSAVPRSTFTARRWADGWRTWGRSRNTSAARPPTSLPGPRGWA
jgi:DNA-binding MurR/RpiR family transcriptional regulator